MTIKPLRHLIPAALACAALGAAIGPALAQTSTTVTVSTGTTTTSPTSASGQDFTGLIAKENLSLQGIATPTTQQLSTETGKVQAMRDSGMGWGAIANQLGIRLGDVVSAANRAKQADSVRAARATDKSAERQTGLKTTGSPSLGIGSEVGGAASSTKGGNGRGGGQGSGGGNSGGGGGNGGGGGGGGGGGRR